MKTRFSRPAVVARVAIVQALTLGWHRYIGEVGTIERMHTLGASAPANMLLGKFGFTLGCADHAGARVDRFGAATNRRERDESDREAGRPGSEHLA
jgi:hypothetical protein